MRPFVLDPIFISVRSLSGIGPKTAKLINVLTGSEKIVSLLWHLPNRIIDRRYTPKIANAVSGKTATITAEIIEHIEPATSSKPYRIRCSDGTGSLDLVYFRANKGWIHKLLPIGRVKVISGEIEYFHGTLQMSHPDMIGEESQRDEIEIVEAVYPMTAGLTHKTMHKIIQQILPKVPSLPEWLDTEVIKRNNWPSWPDAIKKAHSPNSDNDLDCNTVFRERLAYDELLANQLAIALVRNSNQSQNGKSYLPSCDLVDKLIKAIPFELTSAQERSIAEITEDIKQPYKMLRLLQGDVGSGKTIVAMFAMLGAVSNDSQAAIMAPTEILAQQHFKSIEPLATALNLNTVLLTGSHKGKKRSDILKEIESGSVDIIIGTHSLFQKDVIFNDLGIAVIDEQHRFGVHQRIELSNKGKFADVLVMTATPIPRTLTLTAYGDMEVSRLDEKPHTRKPIDTILISNDRIAELTESIKRKIKTGERIYWVCPLIEESEALDLAAAEDRFEHLKEFFPDNISLLHGRMKTNEKEEIMHSFAKGDVQVLVSTTVIEVGVDVPEATVIIIEHAERFGLSQLHQLRGRVGRGDKKSTCILLYDNKIGENGRKRLQTIRNTEDGFLIAEEDLKLRGAGEILGTKQSGMPEFKMANLNEHAHLLHMARDDAKLILNKDESLTSDRGKALKNLLYLFERDNAIKYIRSG